MTEPSGRPRPLTGAEAYLLTCYRRAKRAESDKEARADLQAAVYAFVTALRELGLTGQEVVAHMQEMLVAGGRAAVGEIVPASSSSELLDAVVAWAMAAYLKR